MTGKSYLSSIKEFTPLVNTNKPLGSNHSILQRDKWMVQQCDILLTDIRGTEKPSIGCISELAWGDLLGKHTIVVMEKGNCHEHGFVLEMADVIFETLDAALEYLRKMSIQEI